MSIALFGGSFDPIHFGHLISARSVAERLNLSKVILLPSARPPHKQNAAVTEASHRFAMAQLAAEGDALFDVSDVELKREGPSYTLNTVRYFHRRDPGRSLVWIIGADSLPELPTWYHIAELVEECTIVTAVRPGWTPPPKDLLAAAVGDAKGQELLSNCISTPAIEISATDIRRRVREGLSIRYLVPESVKSYIETHGLYR